MLWAVDLWANWSSEQVGGSPRFNSSSQWQGSYPGTAARQAGAFRSFQFSVFPGGKQDTAGDGCITYLDMHFLVTFCAPPTNRS